MNLKLLSLIRKTTAKIIRISQDFECFIEKQVAKKAGELCLETVIEKCKEVYKVDNVKHEFKMGWDSWEHSITVDVDGNNINPNVEETRIRELSHWLVLTTYPYQKYFRIRYEYNNE